jgi:transposase
MESTGVYWIPPHEVLEAEGFEVLLVNTQQLAQVPGRNKKTDPEDCQWIQRLHSCGLLRGSFRPAEQICMLRTLVRDKANLVAESGDWVRRMQKSLDQMNVRVHRAVSDLNGVTGLAMVQAIVAGQRDPRKLAQLRDRRCRKSEEEIAEQLSGNWREDHLFSLRQGLKMYQTIQERISDYQQEIVQRLAALEQQGYQGQDPPPLPLKKAKTIRKRGQDGMRQALYRMSGVDLTRIDAIGVETVEVVLSEYGPDLSRFPTEKQFVSHATLAPRVPKTGGKPVKKKKKPHSASGRVAAALRMAALSQRYSQTALGAYYRRLAARVGPDVAVFATARRLAVFIYRMIRWGQAYVDEGAQAYELRYQQARLKTLATKAKDLGYQLTPLTP